MTRAQQPALTAFAIGLIGLGVLALVYGDFAMGWQPVAAWIPGRTFLAYCAGVLMLLCGGALLHTKSSMWAARILFPYFVLWALLKVPALFVAPKIEGVWLGIGELTMLLSGAWALLATVGELPDSPFTGARSLRIARFLFGVSVIPVGLSHLFYTKITAGMVPAWMPAHTFLAYFTGIGQMACGLFVILPLCPALAAYGEAVFVGLFTLLLWLPAIFSNAKLRLNWTAFFVSWMIGAACWMVAQNVRTAQTQS